MVILLLSNKWDISIDYVVENLRKCNSDFLRINTEDLLFEQNSVSFHPFSFKLKGRNNELVNNVKSVFFRRPGKPYEFLKSKPNETTLRYLTDQWFSFVSGLESIANVLWINNPRKNGFTEMKINQLYQAEKIGFNIPKTCITNNKDELINFVKSCNNVIGKALYSPLIQDNDEEYFIFTNRLTDISNIDAESISIAPTIFQEELSNKTDYRITIVGSSCFSAEIIYENKSIIDWRTIKDGVKIKKCSLPKDIEDKCIKLVASLGLVFGAIDLVKTNDEYYFLEINPNGEWGWLQKNHDFPIAEAITHQLILGDKHG